MIEANDILSMPVLVIDDKSEDEIECLGQIYRARISPFANRNLFRDKITLTLLKNYSCPGCPACYWIGEEIENALDADRSAACIPKELCSGACYRLDWVGGEYDPFNGDYDGIYPKFTFVDESQFRTEEFKKKRKEIVKKLKELEIEP